MFGCSSASDRDNELVWIQCVRLPSDYAVQSAFHKIPGNRIADSLWNNESHLKFVQFLCFEDCEHKKATTVRTAFLAHVEEFAPQAHTSGAR